MSEGFVKIIHPDPAIAEITFSHPSHNAMPGYLLAQLIQAIETCGSDADTEVIVLKSGGDRTFCAGASFEELMAIDNPASGKKFFLGFAGVINACRKCPKIIIGRVQGKAVGGGVGIASAVDYCLATKFAAIKLSELNIGIGPFVIGPAVSRRIGMSAFSQLSLDANEFQTAAWAKEKGMYAEVHESAEALDAAVMKLAKYLVGTNPEARQQLKKVFWEGTDHWDDLLAERAAMSGQLVLSEHTKKTLKRFAS